MAELAYMFSSTLNVDSQQALMLKPGSPQAFLFSVSFDISCEDAEILKTFKEKVYAILWLTYRRNFFPLNPSTMTFTSDAGWGCMLRTGQMMLAEGLRRHYGESISLQFNTTRKDTMNSNQDNLEPSQNNCTTCSSFDISESRLLITPQHRKLIQWFVDAPKYYSFFSIHRMVQCGQTYGIEIGQWYGPRTACLVLKDLVDSDAQTIKQFPAAKEIVTLVSDDGSIYMDEVVKICNTSKPDKVSSADSSDPLLNTYDFEWEKSLLILIPLRLGLDAINKDYIPGIIEALKFVQCIGMIGGKPKSSLYFFGSQGDNLLYLDPHVAQNCVNTEVSKLDDMLKAEDIKTYHCASFKSMKAEELDPSLAFGFYCRNRSDFMQLRSQIQKLNSLGPSFLTINEKKPDYDSLSVGSNKSVADATLETKEGKTTRNGTKEGLDLTPEKPNTSNDDDFVVL